MSNYLKKLAYVHEAMKKLAMEKEAFGGRLRARLRARIANGGWYPGKFMGRPNPVTGASAHAAPQPVQTSQPAPASASVQTPTRAEQIGKDYKPEPYRPLGVATPRDVDPFFELQTDTYDPFTFGVLPPPSLQDQDSWKFHDEGVYNDIMDSKREFLRERTNLNNANHLRYNADLINKFQDEYVRRYATLNGIDENKARARLRKRLYDTSNMQAIMEQAFNRADRSKKTMRLLNILNGRSVDDEVKWRTPGAGHERESYEDALKNMNARKARKQKGVQNTKAPIPNMGVGQSTPPATTTFSPDTGELNVSTDIDPSQFDPNAHGINDAISPSLVQRPISPAKRQFSVTPYTEEQKNLLNKKRNADSKGYYMDPTSGDVYAEKPINPNDPNYVDEV